MSSTVDPNQRYVNRLEGTGLSLFVVSIVGVALSAVVVGLRTFTRIRARNFGLDDILMLVGMVSNTLNDCALGAWQHQRGAFRSV